jgi:hypothetical protein
MHLVQFGTNFCRQGNDRVSDCCLTPTQQFCSYIMARTCYFQRDDDEFHFVLDQHAVLDLYSASSLKQQSDRHVTYTVTLH